MKIGKWAKLLLLGAPFLAGCGNFWDAPGGGSSGSFALTSGGTISVGSGGGTGTSVITVTPGNSFTGTVALTCAVTTAPTTATGSTDPTCVFSSSSLTFSSATAQTSTMTATTTASTPTGAYTITVTGVSGNVAEKTTVCVAVATSGNCSNTSATSGKFYILNNTSIAGYYINSGTLTPLPSSPYALPSGVTTAYSLAMGPAGNYLWVSTGGGIFHYTIASDGSLTQDTAATISDNVGLAIQVDPSGQWLLDASQTSTSGATLFAFPIDSTGKSTLASGATAPNLGLAAGSTLSLGGMAISPDNNLVAVAEGAAGTQVIPFTKGAAAGANPLGTASLVTHIGTAISVAFAPQTKFLYIGETGDSSSSTNSGGLRVIPITSSTIDTLGTEVAGSPFQSVGTGAQSILPKSTGDFVYAAVWNGTGAGSIVGFSVTPGATPPLVVLSSSAATGDEPVGLAEDSAGNYVLAVSNLGSPTFNSYSFDATTTGKLDGQNTDSTVSAPVAIVAAP